MCIYGQLVYVPVVMTIYIVTTHPFSCVRRQATRESGVMEKRAWQRVGITGSSYCVCEITCARSPPFNCPQATVTTEPHGRWLATIYVTKVLRVQASKYPHFISFGLIFKTFM